MIVSINLLQQLNTISNPNGVGLPVSQYVQAMQTALTDQLTTAPKNQLATLQTSYSALTALQTALTTFQQATFTLASAQTWNAITATSSNSSAFTATASAGAQPSNYSLQVTNVATNQIDIQNLSSQFQKSASGPSNFNSGTIVITPNTLNAGKPVTINVSAGDSLDTIVNNINAQSATTGVQASVINNGQNQYLLSISSMQTGNANGFSLSGTLIGSGTGQLQTTVPSSTANYNAQIVLDGQTITSSSNTFTNNIPNVTIQVSQTMTSAGSLSLTTSANGPESAVQTWMNAYNKLIDLVKQDTAYTPPPAGSSSSQGTAGPLFNDPNATGLLDQLPTVLNQTTSSVGSSAVNSLASLGIVINPQNGHLEFQPSSGFGFSGNNFTGSLQDGKTMFETAMSTNPSAVENFFGVVQNGNSSTAVPVSGVLGSMNKMLQTFLYGSGGAQSPIQGDLNSIQSQETTVQNYLNLVNKQISDQIANYTNQLNALNSAMAQAQSQMQQLGAMFGGTSSASSSSSIP